MKKMLLIVNPRAGKMKIKENLSEIISVFNRAEYSVETVITEGRGDATRAVIDFGKDKSLIACAGGDGTLNETLTGLVNADLHVPIGYIPAGSTNDFASSLGLASDPVVAAEDIVSGFAREYDMGRFGDKYFSYIASFGAFTKASYATPQDMKNSLGHLAYILEGVKEISQIHPYRVKIDLDGRVIEDDFLFVGICNATSIAGLFKIDKSKVDLSDGLFEVLLVRSPRSVTELTNCVNSLTTGNYDSYTVRLLRAEKIIVYSKPDISWSLDGEEAAGEEITEIENLNRRFTLIH